MKQKIYSFFSKRLSILAWVSLLFTIIGQVFGAKYWIAELLTYFVPHAAITLLLASIIFPKASRKTIRVLFFTSAMVLLAWCMMPLSLWSASKSNTQVTIHYQNVNIRNTSPEKTMQQLQPNHILILLEAGSHWKHYLNKTQKNKKFCGVWNDSPFSMQVYWKNSDMSCELFSLANYPAMKITLADARVIFVAHPPPPINTKLAQDRKKYLFELRQLVVATPKAMIVGDLNLSAFSPLYRGFVVKANLERTMLNAHPTWLPFGLSIDQVLFSNKSPKPKVEPLAWHGSDHRGFKILW